MAHHGRSPILIVGAIGLTLVVALVFAAYRWATNADSVPVDHGVALSDGASVEPPSRNESLAPSARVPLEATTDPGSEPRTESPVAAPAGGLNPSARRDEVLSAHVEDLERLRSRFETSSSQHDAVEFHAGRQFLLLTILAEMDAAGQYSDVPQGLRMRGQSPDKVHVVSGNRHYAIDLTEHPTFAQLDSTMNELNRYEGSQKDKLAREQQLLVLSDDQRADIWREYALAIERLASSR